jgi:hypothetical protein
VLSEHPDIAKTADRRAACLLGHQVFRLVAFISNTLENDIDLGGLEANQAYIETNVSQMLQFDREHLIVIAGLFSESIVRKDIGALIVITEMRQANGRDRLHIQQLRRLNAPMSGDNLVIVIDQNGIVKAETLDTPRDLLDLFGRVGTGIARIRPQRVGRPVFKVHLGSPLSWKNLDRTGDPLPHSPRGRRCFMSKIASLERSV